MNAEANKVLTDLLARAVQGIDSAVAFSQAQFPDVVHQLLLWNMVSAVLWQIAALTSIVLLAWNIFRIFKSVKKQNQL